MPSATRINKPGHTTRGDVLDDIGLAPEDALEAKIKAELWRDLLTHLERRAMSQAELARVLKVHQPDVSNLMRGKFSKFSFSKLIQFATKLNLDVHVQLMEPKRRTKQTGGVVPRVFSAKARDAVGLR